MDAAFASYQARFDSFASPKTKSRRTSTRSKKPAAKAAQKGAWPLLSPRPEDLAYAGFVFKPTSTSPDNVQCFSCLTQLDGWEETDVPAYEHLTHSPNCGFAINACIRLRNGDPGRTEDDPLSELMMDARRRTFANLWPLDASAGFPSVEQMVSAGWFYDPGLDAPDGVSCAYCCLSLDAWDAGDDPTEEHRKRSSDCLFFALKDFYHPAQKPKATRGKRSSSRSSTASRKGSKSIRTKKFAGNGDLDKSLPPPPDETTVESHTDSFADSVALAPPKASGKGRASKKAPPPDGLQMESVADSFSDSIVSVPVKAPAKGRRAKEALPDDSRIESLANSFADSIASVPIKATRGRPKKGAALDESRIESVVDSFADSVASGPAKAPTKGRRTKKVPAPDVAPAQSVVESFVDSTRPEPSKAPAKGRKTKATKRVSAISIASTTRSTRRNKRTSEDVGLDEPPQSSPKRARLSDISMPAFESTPVKTPQAVIQAIARSSPSPVQPQTPATPATPENAPAAPAWDPINVDEFFEKRDLFGVVSNVIVDSGLDKENLDVDTNDTAENVVQAVKAGLTSPEKKMTIEEWVMYNAKRGEEKLRIECERQIAAFESQGRRALAVLDAR